MAMMAAAVTVLAPNGRRQQVRVAASTPLLQVLEEVCRKQKLDPKEYGLKFQRTILDLSQQWRFANVPNNAKLEMVATARRHAGTESKVRIALQLEDGSRLQYLFQSGLTLWDLLDHFPETRYVLKRSNVDAQNKAMDLASISDKQPVNKSESKTVLIKVVDGSATEPGSVCSVDDSSPNGLSTEINLHRTMEEFAEKKVPSMDLTQERSKDNTDPFEKKDEDKLSAEQIRSESSENPSDGSAQLVAPDSSCPSEYSEVSDCSASSTKNNGSLALTSFPTGGQDLANSGMDRNQFNLDEPSKATAHSSTSAGPPHPKKSKTVPQQSPLKSSENIEPLKLEPLESSSSKEYLKPVDREPLVYHLDGKNPVQEPSDFEELPDEFFQVTIDDVRKRFAQLKSERRRLEEAPLMTKSMRETYIKEKTERYPKVVLRVQFPDRYVLQGFFRPFETVGALIEFVKMHLIDPAISFYLFKTPPKVLLDQPAATLFEANLFPAALVHFGSEVRMDCYICEEFVKSPTSMSQADLTITSCIPRQVTPSTSSLSCETAVQSPAQSGEEVGERKQPMTHAASAREVQTDSSKVPKWFKLPGKR
ncbi:tether containing UBX domain for GLUT4 isoform X3 [Rhincodon typus]|uniref:tether containing UBX domain for GLUT4 isoform X3 n=1 Tax=Rhincodon typus TaxID=259920 RepID=UPI0020305BCF|nr:tether containing UBX domain for GLUT4 isoform X3 [Rhincodon typus]